MLSYSSLLFTRTGPDDVDEKEVFNGNKNTIEMTESFTIGFGRYFVPIYHLVW